MFNKLLRWVNYLKLKYQNDIQQQPLQESKVIPVNHSIIRKQLAEIFAECSDFVIREIALGGDSNQKILVCYIDGLVNKEIVNRDILKPLMAKELIHRAEQLAASKNILNFIQEGLLNVSDVAIVGEFSKTIEHLLSGDTIVYLNGYTTSLKVGTRDWPQRGVQEPDTEAVVRGPREGFTETLRVNTSLLRRKIRSPDLKIERMTLGERSNTDICICYIKGIVHEDIIKTLKRRLKKIKTDAILESGYIEEFIEDAPFSIFPTVGNTEKPDIAAAKILEGRVVILCAGTPFVLFVPHLLVETIMASEDYYSRPFFSSLVRLMRILAFFITIMLPALYVAAVSFHQDVIPFRLLVTIAYSREGIPFSVFTETVLMGITFELLREAGVRMPRPIGQAVSIVGALVLGQAAVEAGITSNPVVMITALTAITSFILPGLGGVLPILRLILVLGANILGFMGIALLLVSFVIHLCTLRSFGVSYLAPFSPFNGMDLKDSFIRLPIWTMWSRPRALIKRETDSYRMKKDIMTKED